MYLENCSRKEWEKFERNLQFFEKKPRTYRIKAGLVIAWSLLLLGVLCTAALFPLAILIPFWFFFDKQRLASYVTSFFKRRKPCWEYDVFLPPDLFPAFYDKVNSMSYLMKRPTIHRIYIGTVFNAGMSRPRLSFPGFRRNILTIGYPLLCSASMKFINALLVHELEHACIPLFSQETLLGNLHDRWNNRFKGPLRIFSGLMRHHMRLLVLTRHPLSREQEKLADMAICEKLGHKALLESIALTALNTRLFETDKSFIQALADCDDPETMDFPAAVRRIFVRGRDPAYAGRVLSEAMEKVLPIYDRHPSFRGRIGNRDISKLFEYATAVPDAEATLVGRSHDILQAMLNHHYRGIWGPSIPEIKAEYSRMRQILSDTDPDNPQDEFRMLGYVLTAETLGCETLAAAGIRKATEHYPESLTFRAMRLTADLMGAATESDRAESIDELNRLLKIRPWLIYQLNDRLMEYYLCHGMTEHMKELFELRKHCVDVARRETDRPFAPGDDLSEIEFSEDTLNDLRQTFEQEASSVAAIYPVKRRYSADTLIFAQFLVIHKAGWLSVFLGNGKNNRKLIMKYSRLLPSYKLTVGTSKQIALFKQLGIRPIVIPFGTRKYR